MKGELGNSKFHEQMVSVIIKVAFVAPSDNS
jgi:hypothetical protein